MSLLRRLQSRLFAPSVRKPFRRQKLRAPIAADVEALEDRTLLATFTVDNAGDVSDGDFTAGQFTLREAIEQANAMAGVDDIVFDPALNGSTIILTSLLDVTSSMTITGPGATQLAIDGAGGTQLIRIRNNSTVQLDGLTFSNGFSLSQLGGGMQVLNANVTVSNSVFSNNFVTGLLGRGGAVYLNGGSFTAQNVQFMLNGATFAGGAVSVDAGSLTVQNSTFTQNIVNSGNGGGGAISFNGSTLRILDSSLTQNQAQYAGGAIAARGDIEIRRSELIGNMAHNMAQEPGGGGGALFFVEDGTLLISSSLLVGNDAASVGGAISIPIDAPSVRIENSTISGNTADGEGGGIFIGRTSTATLVLVNSTVVRNHGGLGDSVGVTGGGIAYNGSGQFLLNNTLVAANLIGIGAGSPDDLFGVADVNSANNLIGDANTSGGLADGVNGNIVGNGGVGTININTVLDTTLADNGGPTLTHQLVFTGPAVDAGDDLLAVDQNGNPLTSDQRGTPYVRFFDGDGDMLATVDIGAVEAQPRRWVVDTLTDEDDGDFSTGDFSLREALARAITTTEPDIITFDASLATGTIALDVALGELLVDADVTISGLGADMLTIDSEGNSRVFRIAPTRTAEIAGLTITGGDTATDGGGILVEGNLVLRDAALVGNTATGSGGGLATINAGIATLIGVTANDNDALTGGGVSGAGMDLNLINTTVSGNRAVDEGGGVLVANGSDATIVNSTITGNVADNNNADDTGSDLGGGLAIVGTMMARLDNTIIAGNFAGMGNMQVDNDIEGTIDDTSTNNLIGDAATAGGLIDGDNANIVGNNGVGVINIASVISTTLANNGGSTMTHAIVADSPVIDAGNDSRALDELGNPLLTDQRGGLFERFSDGDGDGFNFVDIGAIELQVRIHIVDTIVDGSDMDFSAGMFSLREAIEESNRLPGISIIRFDETLLTNQTIFVTDGILSITDTVSIEGLGQNVLAISGTGNSGIFQIGNGLIVSIDGVTLTDGAGGSGGAVRNNGSDVMVTNTTFFANTAQFGSGGAIYNNNGNLILDGVTMQANTALAFGGGVYTTGFSGNTIVRNSAISGNAAGTLGGGVANLDADTFVYNTTISGNSADQSGGGVANDGGFVSLTNTTITGNRADADGNGFGVGSGGGIHSPDDSGFTGTLLHNSIVIGNFYGGPGAGVPNDIADTLLPSSSNNIVGTPAFSGGLSDGVNGNIVGDGLGGNLAASSVINTTLASNGGTTQTHALAVDSPAVDAGSNFRAIDEMSQALGTDQRGGFFRRIQDGDGDGVALVDIGALEVQGETYVVDTIMDGIDGDISVGNLSLREAVEAANTMPGLNTITFAPTLAGQTIALTDGVLVPMDDVAIVGLGRELLTISGGMSSQLFNPDRALDLRIEAVTLSDGLGTSGGAISNTFGNLTIIDVIMSGNTATSNGGAVLSNSGTLTIINSSFTANNTMGLGGAVAVFGGTAVIEGSTFTNNSADSGGGLSFAGGDGDVINSTVSGNMAADVGGGINVFFEPVNITNSTIAFNEAVNSGGGLGGVIDFVVLNNSLVAGNTTTNGGTMPSDIGSGIDSASSSNLIGDASTSGGLMDGFNGNIVGDGMGGTRDVNTVIAPLADNGGPTQTHALVDGSPAIDAGDNALAIDELGNPLPTDQRGGVFNRFREGNNDMTVTVDIGAFEDQGQVLIVDTLVDESDGDFGMGDFSLREAIEQANMTAGLGVILFNLPVDQTITLTLGELSIMDDVEIVGLGKTSLTISGGNASRVFSVDDGLTVVIQDLTIAGGAAADGAGIVNGDSDLTLTNLLLTDNNATTTGGALFNNGGNVTADGVMIQNNTAGMAGGGVQNVGGLVTLTNSMVTMNSAVNGGGTHNSRAAKTIIDNSDVSGNVAAEEGGGLWNSATGILIIRNGSTVSSNTASGPMADQGGGGIFNDGGGAAQGGGRLAIQSGSAISGNTANGTSGSGGGILTINGVVTVDDSVISGNAANRAGGGIEIITGIVELRNSNLDSNDAGGAAPAPGNGGGLHVTGLMNQVGYVRIFGGTVSGNTAASEGGGLWNQNGNIMVVRMGAVVDGNSASGDAADDGGGGIFNNNGRLSIGEGARISNNSADGLLGSGGGIFTMGSGVTLADGTLIQGNTANRAGGGIEIVNGLLEVLDSTIDGNAATGGGNGPGNGGGIHVSGMSLTRVDLRGSDVTNNTAALEGGGLWHQTGSVMLVRAGSTVTGNTASGDAADDGGGGIFNNGGRLVIFDATIDGNTADGTNGSGGGLLTLNGVVTVENAMISNNTAYRAGGGVEIVDGWLFTRNMTLTGNDAGGMTPAPGNGGGVHVTGTTLTRVRIEGGTISGNTAAREGGGLWHQTGSIMVIFGGTTISGNTASGDLADDGGGGIFNNGGRLAITAATISGNVADGMNAGGGGILSVGGGLTLDNTTVSGNTANGNGGGVVTGGELIAANSTIANNRANADGLGGGNGGGLFNSGKATVHNTLIAGNFGDPGATLSDIAGTSLEATSRNNLISDAGSGGGLVHGVNGNIVGNNGSGFIPAFNIIAPLGPNGGPTLTHAMVGNSLAINAGNNSFAKDVNGISFTFDQRGTGFSRVKNGTVDIGAFES